MKPSRECCGRRHKEDPGLGRRQERLPREVDRWVLKGQTDNARGRGGGEDFWQRRQEGGTKDWACPGKHTQFWVRGPR